MRSARFGFREAPEKKEAPRASVMPPHMEVDPIFLDGVFRMFTPEEEKMVEEKLEDRARKEGGI